MRHSSNLCLNFPRSGQTIEKGTFLVKLVGGGSGIIIVKISHEPTIYCGVLQREYYINSILAVI